LTKGAAQAGDEGARYPRRAKRRDSGTGANPQGRQTVIVKKLLTTPKWYDSYVTVVHKGYFINVTVMHIIGGYMSNKVRVVLSIDEDIWKEFKENVKDYPRGIASWLVERTFADVNLKFEVLGGDEYLEKLFSRKK